MNSIEQYRYFLKDTIRKTINFSNTDQSQGIPAPPVEKPFKPDSIRIPLKAPDQLSEKIKKKDLVSAISSRKSRRNFSSEELSIEELSFLLWATQGIRKSGGSNPAFRTVPSAGARHSFETYLFIMRINGVKKGLYRFLPVENELILLAEMEFMEEQLVHACFGQNYVARGAVTFVWTTIPYRMEWRYSLAAHRVILLDAGHVCQNLYLACEAINAGTCAIGAYDQDELDSLLNIDGTDEFAIYLAPVGKVAAG
ncbi:MAG: SagB/ThcOx family dehydrogenase [Desulfobacterales bacterium]